MTFRFQTFAAGAFLSLAMGLSLPSLADGFYANETLQRQAPDAFALQPEAHDFLVSAYALTIKDGDRLLGLIAEDKALTNAIQQWPEMTIEQQIPWLKKVFALEVRSFGTKAPQLIIDNHSYANKMVYFDFDIEAGGNGIVYLNPDKLAEEEAYASLAFLIHETRHSYQFQQALNANANDIDNDSDSEIVAISAGYLAAFKAQKQLKGFGFSDFLTLLNEFEAFQYGNYVIGQLTDWQIDMINMGTFASQFDNQGQLKIDLNTLLANVDELSLLAQYNELAKEQFELRQRQQ
ncbi:hypothetical protein Q4601_02540 [Shewanella sp. 1_MG-2023]|uniref:hypothetical protein n=1 Tax=unclassified Shewanella TaxID=196818 RepID=UPI0026E2197C|nr:MULTISPECIES: hypothetical protein [unclassified Shewanella]MDO6610690.1 hypothetical protein [Shewanella sp. 7_MG-2023]MDO6770815.1 hypothetical protein [Shewanella sp. 2_MG-2023]MDO6793167.1 hypothetical protein [Shewanella sp. 1_MG-2023]